MLCSTIILTYLSTKGVLSMPKRKSSDLAQFQNWLIKEYCLSKRTATVYASYVRKMLTKLSNVTTDQLDLILAQEWAAQSRDMYYVAWNRFVEYMKKSKRVLLASPSFKSGTRESRKKYYVPPCVLDDLIFLLKEAKLKTSLIPFLKWENFKRIPNSSWEMSDPHESGLFYRVPIEPVVNIYEWGANGMPTAKSPLLPIKPMSLEAIPINPLRRVLRAHKQNRFRS